MNETHTLNGIKYVSRLITEEENTLIDRLRNDELGCQYCELGNTIKVDGSYLSIEKDNLVIENTYMFDNEIASIQISFCPFCRKPL